MLKVWVNLIFAGFGIIYFTLYYVFGYGTLLDLNFNRYNTWGPELLSIINGIVGFLLVVGVIGLFTKVFEEIFKRYFPNNMFLGFILRIIGFTKYFIGLQLFIYFAIVPQGLHVFLNKVYSIGLIIIFLIFITGLVRNYLKGKVITNKRINSESKTLLLFIEKFTLVAIWLIGGITIFDNLGYNISAFVAGAGIGGLAIAFAAQKSISNIFGAITILLNKPFKYDDIVTINGVNGKVDGISLTHVKLIEKSGHIVYVPNDSIISTNIENFTDRKNRKTEFAISVDFNTPMTKIEKATDSIKVVLQKYVKEKTISSYRVSFDALGEYSLNIDVLYFSLYNMDIDKYANQKEEINYEIKKILDKVGISMAFSKQEVAMKQIIDSYMVKK